MKFRQGDVFLARLQTSIRPVIKEPFFEKKTYVLLDQIRAVDVSSRFLKRIGKLSDENLKLIQNSFKSLI